MTYEGRWNNTFLYVLAGLCVALSALGWIAIGVIPTESTTNHGTYPITGIVIVLVCFAIAAVFIRRASKNELQVRADAQGLLVPNFSPDTIAWDDIEGVQVMYMGTGQAARQSILRVALKDPDSYPRATGLRSGMDRLESRFSYGQLGVNTTYLKPRLAELLATIGHYRPDLIQA